MNDVHLDEGQQANIGRDTERAATSHQVSVHAALHYTATQAELSLKKAPKTRREMLARPDAAAFLKAELEHLEKIGQQGLQSYEVISKSLLPQGSRPMRNRWVYALKERAHSGGELEASARLTAKGYTQEGGRVYDETHMPTMSLSSLYMK